MPAQICIYHLKWQDAKQQTALNTIIQRTSTILVDILNYLFQTIREDKV
jgi:hypothetical protein